jgi:hypothetical protein
LIDRSFLKPCLIKLSTQCTNLAWRCRRTDHRNGFCA